MDTLNLVSEDMYRTLFDSLPAMVFITDTTGTLVWHNHFFSDFFALSGASATGKKVSALFHDNDGSSIDCAEVAASGMMRKGVMKSLRMPSSEEKTLKLDYFPQRDAAGEIRGVIGFGLDITEQVQMDQIKGHVYQQIEKNIEQFAILGDHLRNPLTVIIGLCDGMADQARAEKIVTQAKQIDSIIDRIDNGWIESEKIRDFLKKYYDVGVRGTHELVARAIHEEYRAQQVKAGIDEASNPSMRPWHELLPHLKETNIQQAEDIARKLSAVNCAISIAIGEGSPSFAFTGAEVELLAVPEHERWMKEKQQRGWRYGPVRSDYDRVHDCLVPWEKLPETQREKDRNAIRVLPLILAKVHLKIVRLPEKQVFS
ncbi:MAG: RyR domain-containing protein [Methanoregula sp.]